jgi:hypothetical protein
VSAALDHLVRRNEEICLGPHLDHRGDVIRLTGGKGGDHAFVVALIRVVVEPLMRLGVGAETLIVRPKSVLRPLRRVNERNFMPCG